MVSSSSVSMLMSVRGLFSNHSILAIKGLEKSMNSGIGFFVLRSNYVLSLDVLVDIGFDIFYILGKDCKASTLEELVDCNVSSVLLR